ncbi:MAG: radical SAM protein, partial [Candidatus Omnitrophica bacterium]|nr:radical SAM protein [Candidatus Omnitrophota bacterium]
NGQPDRSSSPTSNGRLLEIYQQIWQKTSELIEAGKAPEPLVDRKLDTTSIVINLTDHSKQGLADNLATIGLDLARITPQLTLVPRDLLHITVVDAPGFEDTATKSALQQFFAQSKLISIHLKGVTLASDGTLMVEGYAEDNNIFDLRDELNRQFPAFKSHTPLLHVSLGRITQPITFGEFKNLFESVRELRERDFGVITTDRFRLVVTTNYFGTNRVEEVMLGASSLSTPVNGQPDRSSSPVDVDAIMRKVMPILDGRLADIVERKQIHVQAVIAFMVSFVNRQFDALYNTLDTNLRVNKEEYIVQMGRLWMRYASLVDEAKEALIVATVLHDVGAIKGERDWTHNQMGSHIARTVLPQHGYSVEFADRIAFLVWHHGFWHNLGADFLPIDYQDFSEEDKDTLLLLSVFDFSGRAGGNRLTAENIRYLISLRDILIDDYHRNDKFYEYRMQNLLAPALFTTTAQKEAYLVRFREAFVNSELISGQFIYNWNNLIRTYSFAVFLRIAQESYAAFLCLLHQVNTKVNEAKTEETKTVVIDTDIDFMGMPFDSWALYIHALIADLKEGKAVPMAVEGGAENITITIQLSKYKANEEEARSGSPAVSDFVSVDLKGAFHRQFQEYAHDKWIYHPQAIGPLLEGRFEDIIPVTAEFVPSLICNYHCSTCTYGKPKNGFSGDYKRGLRQFEGGSEKLQDVLGRVEKAQMAFASGKPKCEMMSFETMVLLIDRLQEAGIKAVIFTGGGEPLTNKHTIACMRYAKEKGLKVALYTNGSLLDIHKIKEIMDIEPTFIRISLDAGTQEIFNLTHGLPLDSKILQRVLDNLTAFATEKTKRQSSVNIGVGVIINPLNTKDIDAIARVVRSAYMKAGGGIDLIA